MWFKTIFRNNQPAPAPAASAPEPRLLGESFVRRLERISVVAARQLSGAPAGGEHPSTWRVPGAVFSEHRPYTRGDDYRTIDWNAYARQGEMVVKLGETEQVIDVHVLIDLSRSMASGAPNKLLTAKQLAAAIGYVALTTNDRLHLAPFSDSPLSGFGPAQGKLRAPEALRFLQQLQPVAQTNLAASVREYARRQQRGGVIVIISDLLTGPAQALDDALRALPPPRWQPVVLQIVDRRELQPELLGPVDLEDAETGAVVPVELDEAALAVYKANLDTWQHAISATCARRSATLGQIVTDMPLEKTVLPYLARRKVLS